MSRMRDVEAQRDRLSEATWSVLTERGLPGLTIRAVAERAGCTTGLVMHAFPTKEALLLHARDLLHARTRVDLDAAEGHAATPEEVLRAVMLEAMSLDDASVDVARVWISYLAASLADPVLGARHVEGNRSLIARVTRLLRDCRPEWSDNHAHTEALALISLADGANTLSAADPATYTPALQRRMMTDAITRALAPAQATAESRVSVGVPAEVPTKARESVVDGRMGGTVVDGRTGGTVVDGLMGGTVVANAGVSGIAGIRIRTFEVADTDAVTALWSECGLSRPWNDPRKDITRKLTMQPELFLVAESDGGRIIGTVMAGYDGHRGWVNYLAVDPGLQGRGVGRALMERVETMLVARGCPKLNLQIRDDNEQAQDFYRALGYTRDAAVSFGKRLIPDA